MTDIKNEYIQRKNAQYEYGASQWSIDYRDPVVGSFDAQNDWKDYDNFLFKGIETSGKIAIDFACGPGRNLVKFNKRFARIDGVDIAFNNIEKAKIWLETNNIAIPNLYVNNGMDVSCVPSETYDVVFSTIAIQHISVYDIRFAIFSDFYRMLKKGGHICIQMGFGSSHPSSAGYYENYYDEPHKDTRIESPNEIKSDLDKIGFINFSYDIRPVGPGDSHSNWIFFRAQK